jgi:hypothetical protein
VDDSLLVGCRQATGDLDGVVEGRLRGQRAPIEARPESLALEKLQDDVGNAVLLAGVEHGHEVRMVEHAQRLCFLLETAETVAIRGRIRGQDLDRHVPPQAGVAGAVDLTHASLAQRGKHLVGTEARARCERHDRGIPTESTPEALGMLDSRAASSSDPLACRPSGRPS